MLDAFAMDQSDRAGFSLFPMPPTPPVNRSHAKMILSEQQRNTVPDIPRSGSKQRDSEVPHLRPPPLKLRKKKLVEAKPYTTSSPLSWIELDEPVTPVTPTYHVDPIPQLLVEDVVVDQDTLAPHPTASSARASSVLVPEFSINVQQHPEPELLAPIEASEQDAFRSKRSSYRKSQWLDVQGELDRKKLSVYLSDILDPSFNIEDQSEYLTPLPLDARSSIRERESRLTRDSWKFSFFSGDDRGQSHRGSKIEENPVEDCSCPAGAIICHCSSSPEFERFRRVHADHKPNPSVSSTKCLLSIPRARFRSNLNDVEEMDTPSTPPGLSYDSEETDESDWSLPNSPTFQERRYLNQQTPTPAPRQPLTTAVPRNPPLPRAPVPSFSLPFSHGRQIRPRFHADGDQYESQQSSPTSSIPTLASISTVSTFTFDFGADDETEYDTFDENSEMTEIRTFEPVQKAKPILIHCKGPSPQSIKYGHYRDGHYRRHRVTKSGSISSLEKGYGYATVYVR
ncbi:hypothetical protein PV11_01520 [Exophiala sideris]|uniref:Uncharacterized protein n=1 Tax=Exophiala sideris TaxID=1016849 RepID=A0A0D1YTC0_9EURO|nr:hypothetical protein PV11_01520 [Exophiala sideris]